jgi:hypothetical protein
MATVTAFEIETATVQYTAALDLLLQQENSRLRGTVDSKSGYVGKQVSPIQYLSSVQFKQPGPRGSTLQPQSHQYQRRWLTPQDRDLTIHVDTFDELRTIVDPKAAISRAVMAAANRFFDDLIIGAFFGSALIGVDATSQTTETFDSGSDFPVSVTISDTFKVGSSVGLTPKKMIEAQRILAKYENDLDAVTPNIAVGSQQNDDLMSRMEVISTEYRERPVLENGKIGSFLGFNFHRTERLGYNGSNIRAVPVWLQSGVHLGTWKEMSTVISQRTDLVGHPWQAYSMVAAGASRLQGGQVVQIKCADTTGGPVNV